MLRPPPAVRSAIRSSQPTLGGRSQAGVLHDIHRRVGATILFAGSFQGVTQTLPTAVYSLFDANLDQAVAIGVLLLIFAGTILLSVKFLGAWPSSRSISR